jgi:hypothetical protein
VRSLGRLTLVRRAAGKEVANVDPSDDEDPVLEDDVALRLGSEPAFAGVDPARLQRAT